MARNNEKSRVIYKRVQFILENEEEDRESNGEVEVGRSPEKTIDIYFNKLYYEVTNNSRKEYNLSSL